MFRERKKIKRVRPVVNAELAGKKLGPINNMEILRVLRIKSYLEKSYTRRGQWDLYFCRGEKCPRGPAGRQLSKHRCPDCVKGESGETISHLLERIRQLNNQGGSNG